MKKIVIPIVVITILILIGCFIFIPKHYHSNDVDINEFISNEKKEGQNNNLSTESNETVSTDVVNTEDNDSKEDNNQTKNDKIINESPDSKVNNQDTIKDNKTNDTTNNIDSKKEEIKEEEKNKENNNSEVSNEGNVKTDIIKNPWDELGISEYDYYHKPMWKWARIDYSIDEYKTYEKTREACMTKGEEYFNKGYGYSCTSLNSYSGDYLGEMLKTF